MCQSRRGGINRRRICLAVARHLNSFLLFMSNIYRLFDAQWNSKRISWIKTSTVWYCLVQLMNDSINISSVLQHGNKVSKVGYRKEAKPRMKSCVYSQDGQNQLNKKADRASVIIVSRFAFIVDRRWSSSVKTVEEHLQFVSHNTGFKSWVTQCCIRTLGSYFWDMSDMEVVLSISA